MILTDRLTDSIILTELSESRPPFVIIRMSEFNVAGTHICSLVDIMQIQKKQNKTKPKKSHNPKIKI